MHLHFVLRIMEFLCSQDNINFYTEDFLRLLQITSKPTLSSYQNLMDAPQKTCYLNNTLFILDRYPKGPQHRLLIGDVA